MARVGLMLLMTAVNLALMVNVAKASGLTVDWGTDWMPEWEEKYKDLVENYHKPEEYPKLIDNVLEHLEGSRYGSYQKKNELLRLRGMLQIDLQLCNEEDLKKLRRLSSSSLVGRDFRKYVKAQELKLRQKCIDREIDELEQPLTKMIQLLADFVDLPHNGEPLEGDFYPYHDKYDIDYHDWSYNSHYHEHYYVLYHKVSPGIVNYLIKRAKDDGKPLQSWFRSEQEFEDLYKSQVTDTCQNWIIATDKLNDITRLTLHVESPIVQNLLNYRFLCQDINSKYAPDFEFKAESVSEAIRKLVYYKLWEKLDPK